VRWICLAEANEVKTMNFRYSSSGVRKILQIGLLLTAVCLAAQHAKAVTHRRSRASKQARAEAAYAKATRLDRRLKAKPPLSRSGDEYERVVLSFEEVYKIDPAYVKTPAALTAAAHTYEEMGQTYADDQFYSRAVNAYQFLIQQYPGGSAARHAQFAIGEIYLNDLENPVQAKIAFQKFLQIYPHAPEAKLAERDIEQINTRLSRHRAVVKRASDDGEIGPPPPQPRPPSDRSNQTASPAREVNSDGLVEVTGIRSWVAPNYTRVVITTAAPVTYDASHLVNPDRLVFDLNQTALSSDLRQKVFPVESTYLERVRVAQFQPTVTRVVLDVQKIVTYSVFSLPNPYRMIIDIHGNPGQTAATAAAGSRTTVQSSAGDSASPSGSMRTDDTSDSGRASGAQDDSAADETGASPNARTRQSGVSGKRTTSHRGGSENGGPSVNGGENSEFPGEAQRIRELKDPVSDTVTTVSPKGPLFATRTPTLTRALGLKVGRIVIDPGHGGHDTGTIGPTGLEEKNVVLDVALRLRRLIERRLGAQVIMTRDNDTFIPLEERTAIANEKDADLFISIHANASRDPQARGIEMYYLNFTSDPGALALAARENQTSQESVHQLSKLIQKIALSEKIDESRRFATVEDHSMIRELDREGIREPDRGVKKAPFVVLIGANMPSILCEISFLSNPHDEHMLRRPAFREKIAEALYAGVARYVSQLGAVRVARRSDAGLRQANPPGF
jgi:N-acetylmuramoyl-L-alanine amidase